MHILLSGAGQLGSRYLQGLAQCKSITKITVVDPSQRSLDQSLERYQEAGGSLSTIQSFSRLPDSIQDINLAIIATLSTIRQSIVDQLESQANIQNWILEKVLAPDIEAINLIEKQIGYKQNAWVNTPRRIMPWYSLIKKHIIKSNQNRSPLSLEVSGGRWGLACNAIHFLDLAEWITESSLEDCHIKSPLNWHLAKREGFVEAFGQLHCSLEGGSKLKISCTDQDQMPLTIKIKGKYNDITITEQKNHAFDQITSTELPGNILFQSELTTPLVNQILSERICSLPTLATSAQQHRQLLSCLSKDLNASDLALETGPSIPIT